MVAQPGRTFPAFVRGRRSRNLFRAAYDAALLDRRLGEVRRELGLDAAPAPARLGDGLGLLVHLLLAVPVSLGWLVALLGMAPFALATAHLPRKEAVVLP